jgi:hypothetical protein
MRRLAVTTDLRRQLPDLHAFLRNHGR